MNKATLTGLIIVLIVIGALIVFYLIGTQQSAPTGSSVLKAPSKTTASQQPTNPGLQNRKNKTTPETTAKKGDFSFKAQGKVKNLGCGFSDNAMNPEKIEVGIGSKINWFNIGKNPHQIVVQGLFETKTISPGTVSDYYSLDKKGTFIFYLKDQPKVKGTIVVN